MAFMVEIGLNLRLSYIKLILSEKAHLMPFEEIIKLNA